MDVSSLGSLVSATRSTATTTVKTEDTTQSGFNTAQGQVSLESQSSAIPPVQASSELGGEEGSVVTQDNSGSTNDQTSESGSGDQVDVLA